MHILIAGAGAAFAIVTVREQPEIVQATGRAGVGSVIFALALAALIAGVVAAATHYGRGDRWRLRAPAGRIAASVAVLVALIVAVGPAQDALSNAWDDFRNQRAAPTTSGADPASRFTSFGGGRYEQWESAFRAFRDHPADGIGPGTFEFWWSAEGGGEFVRDAHSLYLEVMAELGLPGLLLLVVALGSLAVLGVRNRVLHRDASGAGMLGALLAAFGVYLFHAALDWTWEVPALTVLALAAVAVAVASTARRSAGIGWPVRLGVVAVAVIAALTQLPPLVSTSQIRESQTAFRANDAAEALDHANQAIEAEPWAASPYVQRGCSRRPRATSTQPERT